MRDHNPTLAVLGAGGFVGRSLLRDLEAEGIKATAIVRGFRDITLDTDFHECVRPNDLGTRKFETVINLAYPTGGRPLEQIALNNEIIDSATALLGNDGHLIHVSSIAVFGITVDRPIRLGPADAIRDISYVESKIKAESELTARQHRHGFGLDIVRLGHVWGAASGNWAVPLTQRLVTGRPVAVRGSAGFSNSTDVANVSSYLIHLARRRAVPDVAFHHLAEFSNVRWPDWIAPMAAKLGVEMTWADSAWLQWPQGPVREMAASLADLAPRKVYRRVSSERQVGSVVRGALRFLPANITERLRSEGLAVRPPEFSRDELTFLTIIAGDQQFKSHLDPQWTPPISQSESLERVIRWIADR